MNNTSLKEKIEEFRIIARRRRRNRIPHRYVLPGNAPVVFRKDENDPGVHFFPSKIVFAPLNDRQNMITINKIVNERLEFVDGVLPACSIIKDDRFRKLIYWHAEPPVLFITHRAFGRLEIHYSEAEWDRFSEDVKMNLDLYGFWCPDTDSSTSEGDGKNQPMGKIPGPDAYPFHREF